MDREGGCIFHRPGDARSAGSGRPTLQSALLPWRPGRVKVLLADDERSIAITLADDLKRAGHKVRVANDGTQALQALGEEPFDVLVSDIGMPGKDGYDLIRLIRALAPEQGGRVPAAALTAYAQHDHRRAALQAGYQLYLPKPVEPAALAEAVAHLAGRA